MGALSGTIELELHADFPGLQLLYVEFAGGDGRSTRETRARLLELSDRFFVASVPALRQKPVPSAYRAFYRQLGVDPDVVANPIEEALVDRLRAGRFRPLGRLHDALVYAGVETQVPLWALDAGDFVGGLGIRGAEPGETLPGTGALTPGQLVVADALRPRAALFSEAPEAAAVHPGTAVTLVYALQVPGVPRYVVEHALDTAGELFAIRD